jgi:TPR repeat protein
LCGLNLPKVTGGAASENGWLYENGFGVKKDYAEAMNWYQKSADQNDADAENHIGWFYQNGWGVKQDYAEAISWYQKAAAQGHVRAKANVELLPRSSRKALPARARRMERLLKRVERFSWWVASRLPTRFTRPILSILKKHGRKSR